MSHGVEREAPRPEDLREQPVRPAVHVVGEQHVVARAQRQQQRRLGAQPAARTQRRFAPPSSEASTCCERLARRVAAARVVPDLRLADRGLRVRRGLVDRDVDRAVLARRGPGPRGSPGSRTVPRSRHRISGGICPARAAAAPRPRPGPARARAPQQRLALGVVPRRELRPVSAVQRGIPARARREPGSERLSRRGPARRPRAVRVGGERRGGQDDLALRRVARARTARSSANSPVSAASAASTWSAERSASASTPLRAQHRRAPRVLARCPSGGRHPGSTTAVACGKTSIADPFPGPPPGTAGTGGLDRAERLEADRHPLVERVLGHLRVRRRVEALDPEPPQLAFGAGGSGPTTPTSAGRRSPRRRGRRSAHELVQVVHGDVPSGVQDRPVAVEQDEVEPLANPDVDPERAHVRRGLRCARNSSRSLRVRTPST